MRLNIHDCLEERAKNGRRYARPVKVCASKQCVAHIKIEIGEAQTFLEQIPIDVGECGKRFVEVFLALLGRRIQHIEKVCEVQAEIGAILGGSVQQVELEGFGLEDAGVFGEEAKKYSDEEAFELMPGIAACFQRVMEATHDFDRFDIDWVLFLELVLLVARYECKSVDIFVELGEREFDGGDAPAVEER